MKYLKSYLILLVCLNLTGCSPFKKIQTRKQTISYTPEVKKEIVVNNVTNTIFLPSLAITNYYTNTVYEITPEVKTVISTLGIINSDYNVTPTSSPITALLLVLSGFLGFIAKRKSDKANMLDTVILGVENAGENTLVKNSIANTAKISGNYLALDKVIQSIVK